MAIKITVTFSQTQSQSVTWSEVISLPFIFFHISIHLWGECEWKLARKKHQRHPIIHIDCCYRSIPDGCMSLRLPNTTLVSITMTRINDPTHYLHKLRLLLFFSHIHTHLELDVFSKANHLTRYRTHVFSAHAWLCLCQLLAESFNARMTLRSL